MRRVGRVLIIVAFVLLSVPALMNGIRELGHVDSWLQNSVEIGDLLHGTLSLLVALGILRRRPWTFPVAVAWCVAVVYTATVASFSFSDPTFKESSTLLGVIAAG
ncbi:MAG TPA: hypothetical protein VF483_12295, partial [Gemmatimonadaceae bacterium]